MKPVVSALVGLLFGASSCVLLISFARRFVRQPVPPSKLPLLLAYILAMLGAPVVVILYILQRNWGKQCGRMAFWLWVLPLLICEVYVARKYYYLR
jgi:divalent metal cation (Fe/Co/Zn/Cd) transporter